jgi:hypothetical protein
MTPIDWHGFELEPLASHLRDEHGGADGERMVWAFEQALGVARVDGELLEHLLAATVCLLAKASGRPPRDVLETFFRRSVPDEQWRERYLPLFGHV